jgi:MarR family transcriptional repressor of emrRAB
MPHLMHNAYDVAMVHRAEQLLGVVALVAVDRLRSEVANESAVRGAEAGALVHVQAWPGGSVGDLASVIGRSQPATVRLVDRLVGRGLLKREPGADRRTIALRLTDAGARGADAVLTARAEALAPLLAELNANERVKLERLLGKVMAGLAVDRQGALSVCRLCDRATCASGPGCPLDHTATGS